MDIEKFDEGLKTCKMCLSDNRTSYHKHKHKRNEVQRKRYEEDEEYRKTKQDYNKTFQSKIGRLLPWWSPPWHNILT